MWTAFHLIQLCGCFGLLVLHSRPSLMWFCCPHELDLEKINKQRKKRKKVKKRKRKKRKKREKTKKEKKRKKKKKEKTNAKHFCEVNSR